MCRALRFTGVRAFRFRQRIRGAGGSSARSGYRRRPFHGSTRGGADSRRWCSRSVSRPRDLLLHPGLHPWSVSGSAVDFPQHVHRAGRVGVATVASPP